MKLNQLVCPVSHIKIDSHVSRINVFLSSILIALYAVTHDPNYMAVVAIDYGIRAFWEPHYSLLRWVASRIAKLFRFPGQKIDLAPKVFALRLGFLCAVATMLLFYLQMPIASILVASISLGLTLLDSVFNICVGCLIYHSLVFPFYQRRLNHSNVHV